MFAALIELVAELFPSVSPTTVARCLREVTQQDFDPGRLFLPRPFEYLAQGDVIAPIAFLMVEEGGELFRYDGPAVLLSNTCDSEHDENVLLAASYPFGTLLEDNPVDENSLRNNCILNLLYLPMIGDDGRGIVADLSWIQAHRRDWVVSALQRGQIRKLYSLSDIGFYLLLAKLTLHLLRPETPETVEKRGTQVAP